MLNDSVRLLELDHRGGQVRSVASHAFRSACGQHEEPQHEYDPHDKATPSSNGGVMDRSTSDFADTDERVSLDESEGERDIFDEMLAPSDLVDEAADLSKYHSANSTSSFEEVFALRRDRMDYCLRTLMKSKL